MQNLSCLLFNWWTDLRVLNENHQIQSFSAFNSIYNHSGLFGIQATTVRKSFKFAHNFRWILLFFGGIFALCLICGLYVVISMFLNYFSFFFFCFLLAFSFVSFAAFDILIWQSSKCFSMIIWCVFWILMHWHDPIFLERRG